VSFPEPRCDRQVARSRWRQSNDRAPCKVERKTGPRGPFLWPSVATRGCRALWVAAARFYGTKFCLILPVLLAADPPPQGVVIPASSSTIDPRPQFFVSIETMSSAACVATFGSTIPTAGVYVITAAVIASGHGARVSRFGAQATVIARAPRADDGHFRDLTRACMESLRG
jgi:hypothetical protein